jgi:diaminopimelate decarboxylase
VNESLSIAAVMSAFRPAVRQLASDVGTPLFVYRPDIAMARMREVRRAFSWAASGVELLFALKSNPHGALLQRVHGDLDGVDVSSGGELERVLLLGISADRVSVTGPAKAEATLLRAVDAGVGAVCVESVDELGLLAELAKQRGVRVGVRLRINPKEPILAYAIGIGGRPSPFGIDIEDVGASASVLSSNEKWLRYLGPHCFAGAQCVSARALLRHFEQSLRVDRLLRSAYGLQSESINFGGGLAWRCLRTTSRSI